VQVSHEGKPHCIHRTFAEYYVADCLVNRLTEGNNTSGQVLDFILEDILLKDIIECFEFLWMAFCQNLSRQKGC